MVEFVFLRCQKVVKFRQVFDDELMTFPQVLIGQLLAILFFKQLLIDDRLLQGVPWPSYSLTDVQTENMLTCSHNKKSDASCLKETSLDDRRLFDDCALLQDGFFSKVEDILAVSLHALVLLLGADNDLLELAETSTCGNEVTADNVLLHAFEGIALATDGSLFSSLGCMV